MKDSYRYHKKPVVCVETGTSFESIREASKWLGGNIAQNESNIWSICMKKHYVYGNKNFTRKTCKGYHWKFKENGYDYKMQK